VCVRTLALALAFLAFGITAFGKGQTAAVGKHRSAKSEPLDLLIQSYLLSKNFVPGERAFLLMRLTQEAPDAADRGHIRTWCAELFRVIDTLPSNEENKVAIRANALKALARVDIKQALQLFDTVGDLPSDLSDDPRAYVAISIFAAAYRSEGIHIIPELRSHALKLAATGEYPYLAMLPIAQAESKRKTPAATELFADGLRAYKTGSTVQRKSNKDFVTFIKGLHGDLPKPLVREALETCVGKLLDDRQRDSERYFARVQTATGSFVFSSESDELLLNLTPLLKTYDPQLLDELGKEHPAVTVLNGASTNPVSTESATVRGNPPSSEIHRLETEALQRDRLNNILETASENPEQARTQAEALSDPGMRAVAEAAIAAGYASKNKELSSAAYGRSKSSLPRLTDDQTRLELLAGLAEAAAANNDLPELMEVVERGLDLGSELFQEDMDAHPGKSAIFFDKFDDLSRLVHVGVKMSPGNTLTLMDQLTNPVLRAYLLVDAAQALAERQTKKGRSQSSAD